MPDMPPVFRMPGTLSSDEKRPNSHQRGYDRTWSKMAKLYKAHYPFCAQCERDGRDGVPAEHVDHIIPFRGNIELRNDPENWQSLCAECHGRKTRGEMLGDGPVIVIVPNSQLPRLELSEEL